MSVVDIILAIIIGVFLLCAIIVSWIFFLDYQNNISFYEQRKLQLILDLAKYKNLKMKKEEKENA